MSSHIIFEIITILNTRAHVITVEFDFFDERNIIHPSVFHQIVYVRRRSIFFYTFHFPLGQKNKHRDRGSKCKEQWCRKISSFSSTKTILNVWSKKLYFVFTSFFVITIRRGGTSFSIYVAK